MNAAASSHPLRRTAGRPRRLTLDAIIDAAIALGLDRIEMARIAERLGVGVATLYGYVKGREHLLALIADRRARRDLLVDRGQSWQTILREHADGSFAIYAAWPQLIGLMMDGSIGRAMETAYLERLLALLVARGIAPADALALYYRVNQLVVGAAVGAAYARAAHEDGADAADPLAHAADADTPTLRRCLAEGAAAAAAARGDYRTPLDLLIAHHVTTIAAAPATKESPADVDPHRP